MFKDKDLGGMYIAIRGRLMKAVSHIVPPKDIEDIVQETYVRVCQIENKQTINYPRSFMFKTARNLALDHVKRAESRLTSGVSEDDEFDLGIVDGSSNEPYERVVSNSEFASFCEAVRQLPVQCRRVFVLKKVYGYSQKEISRSLGISQSTVEKHISTGIKRCTHFMSKQTDNGDVGSSLSPKSSVDSKVVSLQNCERGKQ